MSSLDVESPAQLRRNAEARLHQGAPASASKGWHTGVQALTLLHDLSSTPARAGDALKLLHELQVHQVELDLQQEQADEQRQRLSEALAYQKILFDALPCACLSLSPDGVIREANARAIEQLGLPAEHLPGRPLAELLTPESQCIFRQVLRDALNPRPAAAMAPATIALSSDRGHFQLVAQTAPSGGLVMLSLWPQPLHTGH